MLIRAINFAVKLTNWHREFYMCPELFIHILHEAIPELCGDRPSYTWTTDAQEHLIRLHNIVADKWKLTPDEDTSIPHHPVMVDRRIEEYLSISRFPLLRHEARTALNPDRGV